ncbi:putative transcription factor WRKY family [Lupinus albus]|uniref:Putative transcription factor WRKY family n=1 Tax=Lupinus albus TaxID=3870 RepID=A0A6A4NAV8_LUPAL|nr:putative transcription factor WRKY family [Lupinus albus]
MIIKRKVRKILRNLDMLFKQGVRKYGQKAVKNNKFQRSYYRCTHQECNMKKQVQRLTKDEGVVVTTYEGVHIHPIEKKTDNFEHILSQMQIYVPF